MIWDEELFSRGRGREGGNAGEIQTDFWHCFSSLLFPLDLPKGKKKLSHAACKSDPPVLES